MAINEIFVIYAPIGAFICSAALLWVIRDPKTPPWLDVAASIMLLLFSAMFLGMLQAIYNGLPEISAKERDIKTQYQIALYLVPFFTAGLATNILSNVILAHRDYTGTIPFSEAATKLLWAIWLVILTLSVFGLIVYAAYKQWGKS